MYFANYLFLLLTGARSFWKDRQNLHLTTFVFYRLLLILILSDQQPRQRRDRSSPPEDLYQTSQRRTPVPPGLFVLRMVCRWSIRDHAQRHPSSGNVGFRGERQRLGWRVSQEEGPTQAGTGGLAESLAKRWPS